MWHGPMKHSMGPDCWKTTAFILFAAALSLHCTAAFVSTHQPVTTRWTCGAMQEVDERRVVSPSYQSGRACYGHYTRPSCGPRHQSPSRLHMAALNFDGQSSASIFVPIPPDISISERTLPEWLLHSAVSSDRVLHGTDDYRLRKDGMYDCVQPSVDWFGLELVPVFVNRIDRSESGAGGVTVRIVDARSEIRSGGGGPAGAVIQSVMKKSKFAGRYGISWRAAPQRSASRRDGWTLSADLALTLTVPLPGLLPLPPGFNSIGSSIVKSTCRKRVEQNLVDLRDAYVLWARQSEDSTQ